MTRLALHTAVALAILAGLVVAWQLRYPVLLFVVSLAISAALRPLVDRLLARRWPKALAVTVAYLQLIGALALLALMSIQPLVAETKRFGQITYDAYDQVEKTWPERGGWRAAAIRRIPAPEDVYHEMLGSQGMSLLQTALGATFDLFSNLIDAIVVIVMSLYWSIDRDRFERLWLTAMPARHRAAARDVWRSMENESGDYLRSEIMQSAAAGLLLWMGLSMIGYPFPVMAAVAGAIAWLVPWVGMLLTAVGVVVFALPSLVQHNLGSPWVWLLLSVAYTFAVLLFLEMVVEPRVFGRRRYNWLLVAIMMIGLADSLGIVGLVLGPPLAAILQTLGGRLLRHRMASDAETDDADLAEEVAQLRESIAHEEQPTPELASIVQRLDNLVHEAQPVLPEHDGQPAEAAPAGATDVQHPATP
jgi:predicted PurR-regulated permease PerM